MKKFLLLLLAIALLIGCSGLKLGEPKIESVSHHWGEITDRTTEIITDVLVYNPNPVPIPIKSISVEIYMNDIKMGEGKNIGPAELKGNGYTTIKLSTKIDNTKIPTWWVSHLKNGEKSTLMIKIMPTIEVFGQKLQFTLLEEKTEIKTNILGGKQ